MSDEFYNPFHFVPAEKPRIDVMARDLLSKTPTERASHQHVTHDRYVTDAAVYSGRIVCRLRLDAPTVIGAGRTPATNDQPAVVDPYQILAEYTRANGHSEFDWEPAIPETTLRGMISSVFEAATSSTMRVLSDTPLSVRMAAMASGEQRSEALQAVGMIHVDSEGRRTLLPLTFPALEGKQNTYSVPQSFWKYETFAQVKTYLNNQWHVDSSTPDNRLIYFLKTTFRPAVNGHRLNGVVDPAVKGRFLVARYENSALKTRIQWEALPQEQRSQYTPGLLRNLGKRSCAALEEHRAPDDNQERELPPGVHHQWFIPLHPSVYDPQQNTWVYEAKGLSLLDAEDAALRFEAIARARTNVDLSLPYELRGSLRNAEDKQRDHAKSHEIKLRQGDLVCFDLLDGLELAISSIWRRPAGTVWGWFAQLDPDLVPMNATRGRVTVAEQLFGFVEPTTNEDKRTRVKALAGRVRFSSGRLCSRKPDGGYFEEPRVSQILGAPKPPSPQFYFRKTNGAAFKKRALPRRVSSEFAPLGRKVYLHHDPALRNWTTEDPQKDKKQKATLTPLRANSEFVFDIDFDNLQRHELALLIWCLKPTPQFRHRLGLAKPLGLGVIDIQPAAVFFVDRQKRYAEEDLLSADRYHLVSRCDSSAQAFLDLTCAAADVQQRYVTEVAAWSQLEAGPAWTSLYQDAVKLLEANAPNAKAAVEGLGDPATTQGVPVHYPRLPDALQLDEDDALRLEARLYQWHVWNDDRPKPDSLRALSKANPTPNKLHKQTPFRFFLYSHLPEAQQTELSRLLEKHYPRAYHPASGPLARSPAEYDSEIRDAIKQGLIPVHLGVDRQGEKVNRDYLAPNHGVIVANPARPQDVVEKFRAKYLPISNAH